MNRKLLIARGYAALLWLMTLLPCFAFSQELAYGAGAQKTRSHSTQPTLLDLRDVLLNAQRTYQVNIVFEDDLIKGHKVDVKSIKASQPVHEYLKAVLAGTELEVLRIRRDRYLVVKSADKPGAASAFIQSQAAMLPKANEPYLPLTKSTKFSADIGVKGKVTDDKGEALPGVSILLKGTQQGTLSDIDGNFEFNVPSGASTLVFSYVGYLPQEVTVGNQTTLTIRMAADEKALQELVVVGYGVQKKVNVTGAVSQVGSEMLENRAVTNVSQALQGTMPGVTVQASDGRPGAASSIRVRGFSSLNSGGALIIVDGTPGSLNTLNPNDIESISVLKDAASAAIYGARGAEGVVLVTTKTGSSGKVSIKYQGGVTLMKPTQYPKLAHSYDGASLANLSAKNAGASPFFTDAQIQAMRDPSVESMPRANGQEWDYVADFDWAGYFLKNSFNQNHNLSINGGGANSRYLISAGWLDQNGYFSKYGPDNFDRYNVRVNLVNELVPSKLTLDTRLSLSSSLRNESSTGTNYIMQSVNQAGRSMPIYNEDGSYARFRMQQNTLQLLKEAGFDKTLNNYVEARVSLGWNITKDLNVKALGGYNVYWGKDTLFGRGYYKYRPAGGEFRLGQQAHSDNPGH